MCRSRGWKGVGVGLLGVVRFAVGLGVSGLYVVCRGVWRGGVHSPSLSGTTWGRCLA